MVMKTRKFRFFSARGGGAYLANGQYRIRKYRRCCRDDVHIVPTAIQNGKILHNPRGFPWVRSKFRGERFCAPNPKWNYGSVMNSIGKCPIYFFFTNRMEPALQVLWECMYTPVFAKK